LESPFRYPSLVRSDRVCFKGATVSHQMISIEIRINEIRATTGEKPSEAGH
jgi:hypothetical protein